MRIFRFLLTAALATACGGPQPGHIDGGVLGRVVVYRNGVAFYERTTRVVDGKVTVRVPRERVDDFLKSLTVVDTRTKKPLMVTIPRQQSYDGPFLEMTLDTPEVAVADVLLTYVTEAPAWKPSYRVVVGTKNKVMPSVAKVAEKQAAQRPRDLGPDTPVGESHFMADRPMTVKAGSSAMVSMVRGETTGGVVYLYDPISTRGDQRFAFKAVRLDNPTAETLEPGPVTVYGDGRFIGEGIMRSSTELAASLRTKAQEIAEHIQKTTLAVVNAQEQLMMTRVKLANQLADLRLTDVTKSEVSAR